MDETIQTHSLGRKECKIIEFYNILPVNRNEHIILLTITYYAIYNAADVRNPCPKLFSSFHDIPK